MADFKVHGKLDTAVALTLNDSEVSNGKWKTAPSSTVSTGTHAIFEAWNHDGLDYGPEGWAKYQAADGSIFKFSFDDPRYRDNECKSSIEQNNGPWTCPTPDYPQTGFNWTVTYYIDSGSEFYDAPVFPDDVHAAQKCDAYTQERVTGWIGERQYVNLAIAFGQNIPVQGKIWCLEGNLFLTPRSRITLTLDLADLVVREMKEIGGDVRQAEALIDAYAGVHAGKSSRAELNAAVAALSDSLKGSEAGNLADVLLMMNNPDTDTAWVNMLGSYIGVDGIKNRDQRGATIVEMVSQRL